MASVVVGWVSSKSKVPNPFSVKFLNLSNVQLGQFNPGECSYNLIETFKLNQTEENFQVNISTSANSGLKFPAKVEK